MMIMTGILFVMIRKINANDDDADDDDDRWW